MSAKIQGPECCAASPTAFYMHITSARLHINKTKYFHELELA
jgi:hypothetical protein